MVKEQLLDRGIKDSLVIDAFYRVARHKFTPDDYLGESYSDHPLPIGRGQTISQPYIVALMTEKLGLKGKEKVLEIGTGSGYQTAILAEICDRVITVERDRQLFERAKEVLYGQGYSNITFIHADGTLGAPAEAPFDRIIVTAAAPDVPAPLLEQLNDKGKMIIPAGDTYAQRLILIEKSGQQFQRRELGGCVFVPLKGVYGWKE
jgi:protein-L-isoaspartate(D-aspartate) O-methyltransferase